MSVIEPASPRRRISRKDDLWGFRNGPYCTEYCLYLSRTRLRDRSLTPLVCASYIPAGASDHPLGGMGFVNLMLEVAEQEQSLGVYFDTIIVCSVTGSSHAGTLAGAVLEGKGRKVIGIDASGKPEATKDQVARIARDTVARLDPEAVVPDEAIVLDERFHAGIYGIPDEETIAAMKRECGVRAVEVVGIGQHEWYTTTSTSLTPPVAAQTDALITDPVYEVSPTTPRFRAKSHRTESPMLHVQSASYGVRPPQRHLGDEEAPR